MFMRFPSQEEAARLGQPETVSIPNGRGDPKVAVEWARPMKAEDEARGADTASEVQRLVRAARLDEAEAVARSVPAAAAGGVAQAQVIALAALGTALFQAGHREKGAEVLTEAEGLARRLRRAGHWDEASALFEIGQAWRDAGDCAQAMRLWDASVEAVDGQDTARLLAALYRESRQMGLWDRGHRVLAMLPRRRAPGGEPAPKPGGYDSR
jgi:hypothetical protein